MIIIRTPFRISFFGGGTDFPEFFKIHNGAVISTTINKYCYIMMRFLPPFFDYKYRLRYSEREEVSKIIDIKHPVIRESLRKYNLQKGIEIVHTSDIPARSGIGSSSAFTVSLIHALNAIQGKIVTKRYLASEAIDMEQKILKENVGCQDQVACAFGGFNRIDFSDDLHFYVSPITISKERLIYFQNNLMLFFTGFTRFSSEVSAEQKKNISRNEKELNVIKEMVNEITNILNSPNRSLEDIGKLLDESWKLKKSLSKNVSNKTLDTIYTTARNAGAIGGKILGAGGGGFLLLYVPLECQNYVRDKLKNLLYVPFKFENLGSQITMYAPGSGIDEIITT